MCGRNVPHRFRKQRFETNAFKDLGTNYKKLATFTNKLISPELFAGTTKEFRRIFLNIHKYVCTFDIYVKQIGF